MANKWPNLSYVKENVTQNDVHHAIMTNNNVCQHFYLVDERLQTFLLRFAFYLERNLQHIYEHPSKATYYSDCFSRLIQTFFVLTQIINTMKQRNFLLEQLMRKIFLRYNVFLQMTTYSLTGKNAHFMTQH